MAQKTNLNISPYFDDFDPEKNFYRVLFKPGFPVQARELTTLQSILQNQIESFGSHFFKDGSMVIPGSIVYDNAYYSIKINPQNLGVDVSLYVFELIGKKIEGEISGRTAIVKGVDIPPTNNVTDITLYLKYISSGIEYDCEQFQDGEVLRVLEPITYGNTTIPANNSVATTVDFEASSTGSLVGMTSGVYFIRGTFVNVPDSQVVLDPYSNTSSYRVGLTIVEEIVSSVEDSSLADNASGFSNYASPGADRIKITAFLSKKPIDDFDDKNFIELVKIENGEIKKLQNTSEYSTIKDYLAKRTYDESGNYSLTPFTVNIQNSLSDRISNNGIYLPTQKTTDGNVPSEDLMCVNISPGKAYIYGYDVESIKNTIIDVEKPRDTATEPLAFVPFEMGNLLKVNNVYGTPIIGINTSLNTVNFYNRRRNSTSAGTGTNIGRARIYSYGLSDAPYESAKTEWDLYLFDIQLYTVITLNQSATLSEIPESSYIEGINSGASAYVVTSPNGSDLVTIAQVSGTFISGEPIKVNGVRSLSRSIKSIKKYSSEDIKSLWQDTTSFSNGTINTDFVADTVLYKEIATGFSISDRITVTTSGQVTCQGRSFIGIRSDAIIAYQIQGTSDLTYNKVDSVSSDGNTMTVSAITPNVAGISNGSLPASTLTTTFNILTPKIKNQDKSKLYQPLGKNNISNVDLSNSELICSYQITGQSSSGSGELGIDNSTLPGITNAYFTAFDQERYSIIYSDGTVEKLTSEQVDVNSGGNFISFTGLRASQSNITVNVTLNKNFIRSKSKIYTRSEKLSVNKTSTGISTSTTGLTYNQYYGLRIEDKEISLNVPDAVKIIAVYESLDNSAPTLDTLGFVSGLSLNTNAYLGEKIIGEESQAIAQVVGRTSNSIEFVYLNSNKFVLGETVTFEESNIVTSIVSITNGNYLDLTSRYFLDKGQKDQYYDYSRIVRTNNTTAPSRQLLVIFDWYDVLSSDSGDLYTVNSYSKERYNKDIPMLDYEIDELTKQIRATDVIDFRPRVKKFTSSSSSPFYFNNRNFGSDFSITPNLVISPGESSSIGYSYYLPRIDKLTLNKLGQFSLIKGISSLNPKEPINKEEAMDIAIVNLPAYLYDSDIDKISISLIDNKRYTMKDIGKIENRIEILEITTSLSLLEVSTQSLQIQDADGLTRFKTGFFVDDFKDTKFINLQNPDTQCTVNTETQSLESMTHSWSLKPILALNNSIDPQTADYSSDIDLLDPNVKKTGDLITLNYVEKEWIKQPFASRVENINPFNIITYNSSITLNPVTDEWVRNFYTTTYITTSTGSDGASYDYTNSVSVTNQSDTYARSRNVEFRVGAIRSFTRHYPFMNDSSAIDIIPKLVEIRMVSGLFQTGEDVVSQDGTFKCRIAQPNHKYGAYNNPSYTFTLNPYDKTQNLPSAYSGTSTILNLDTRALADESLGAYYGYITTGTRLYGRISGAVADVTDIRLISDSVGHLLGCFWIRDPNGTNSALKLPNGDNTFKLTASKDNQELIAGSTVLASEAAGIYRTSGIIRTTVTNIVQVRNPPPPPPPPPPPAPIIIQVPVFVPTPTPPPPPPPPPPRRRCSKKDPLAQTFTVDETGAFLTSVDLYFANKDENEPVYVEVRTVELGTPTSQVIQDYATAVLLPDKIKTSNDASVATNVKFSSPVYLQPGTEYALVLLSPTSDNNEVWIARTGEATIETQKLPSAEAILVTSQYIGGSLFKSQNGTIWSPSQYEDLKFTLFKAQFTSSPGEVLYYNPDLGVNDYNIPKLIDNPIKTYPRKLKVGITTSTGLGSILTIGKKVGAGGESPSGFIEQIGSEISSVNVSASGTSYVNGTYSNVSLYPITGGGSGAIGIVTVASGIVSSVYVTQTGNGYSVGDVLGITTSEVGGKGSNGTITVSGINGIDTLYLTGVQGEGFYLNSTTSLYVYNGTSWVSLGSTYVTSSSVVSDLYSGNIIEVTQFNHGMHSDNNSISIGNVFPDTVPTYLSAALSVTDNSISVVDGSIFNTFEGISTTGGYVLIGNEVIEYDSVSSNSLGIKNRGIQDSQIQSHSSGESVYKYEINGVSLTRINTDQAISSNQELKKIRDFDTYHIEVDMSPRASGNTKLNFQDEKSIGGNKVSVTQNIQYSSIVPQFSVINPGQNTKLTAQVRTITATSASGTEDSFIDKGYEDVQLNKVNYFDTPRMVASKVNEASNLVDLPQNKSFTLKIRMETGDSNLSPVIDTQNGFIIYNRNRINKPIDDYVLDGRVNLVSGDPHTSIYISNKINLQQPASSLKVILTAERPEECDFRVLYQIFKSGSDDFNPSYELFPGYDNLRDSDGDGFGDTIINASKNNGRPDSYIPPSRLNEYREYQYSIDNLDQFNAFSIKIVMSSSNESKIVKIKDLRVIALA